MSIIAFLKKNVTVAIYETGVDGENDAMNIFQKLITTGITNFEINHKKMLKIAHHMCSVYFACKKKGLKEEKTFIEEIT